VSRRDLEGRTFVVTGANSGIGRVTAAALARRGARVFAGCRSRDVAETTARALRAEAGGDTAAIEPLPIDLADLASVRAAAGDLRARGLPLHGLVNNAGVAATGRVTRQGVELCFGVNHLGHFVLTRLLEAPLRAAAPARVVNVSSQAHRRAPGIDFGALRAPGRSITGIPEYAVSKLCNILFTRELARRWADRGVHSYALHPGVVATRIWRRVPNPLRWLGMRLMLPPEEGARTTLYCATAPELAAASGRYYVGEREADPSRVAQDEALAARLWEESEKLEAL
jgi:NAD(P)-dependent dehydrogenase (short-subunit alcohol dehydrogenase family)